MAVIEGLLPGSPTGQVVAVGKTGLFRGYNLRETAGAAAVVRIYANAQGGTLLATVALASSGSVDYVYSLDDALPFTSGVYVQTVSGTTPEGFVRWSSRL